jgi:hypothetical protein
METIDLTVETIKKERKNNNNNDEHLIAQFEFHQTDQQI